MADGTFPSVVSKDNNVNAVDNAIFVQLSDGSSAVSITSNALDVNVNNTVTVEASNLDIRDLTQASDSILIYANTAKDGSGTNYVPLVDADGNLQVDVLTLPAISMNNEYVDDSAFTIASDVVGATGFLADETATDSVDEGDIGIARMTLDRKIITSSEQSGTWNIDTVTTLTSITNDVNIADGGNTITVDADQLDVDDLNLTDDAVRISGNTNANSETNPIYVKVTDTDASSVEVHDFDQASAVSASGTDNHDYTVSGTTFFLKSVIISASGNAKFEIQVGALASLATVAVGFLTGREGDTQQVVGRGKSSPLTT